jgi:hypothetical protein
VSASSAGALPGGKGYAASVLPNAPVTPHETAVPVDQLQPRADDTAFGPDGWPAGAAAMFVLVVVVAAIAIAIAIVVTFVALIRNHRRIFRR